MKYIIGNWKMNGLLKDAAELTEASIKAPVPTGVNIVIAPPFTGLSTIMHYLSGSGIAIAAQDCSPERAGAYTGDTSADMIKDTGCSYVIVGHSERRTIHRETSELVKRKAQAALNAGIKPIICVGETIAERESGKYLDIIARQVNDSVPQLLQSDKYLVAYEPVWAIGSGRTPTDTEITEVHKTIASLLVRGKEEAGKTAILYGGSVNSANAHKIMALEGVDGVLVGGASIKADEWKKIIEGVKF
jgi:triosephosphate isomerase